MTVGIDLESALANVKFLDGRTRHSDTTDTFARLTEYRDGAIYAGGFSGVSPWERHPADEIVHILKGEAVISLAFNQGTESQVLKAGMIIVVPQNIWHRFDAADGVTLMSITPQPSEHTTDEAPPPSD